MIIKQPSVLQRARIKHPYPTEGTSFTECIDLESMDFHDYSSFPLLNTVAFLFRQKYSMTVSEVTSIADYSCNLYIISCMSESEVFEYVRLLEDIWLGKVELSEKSNFVYSKRLVNPMALPKENWQEAHAAAIEARKTDLWIDIENHAIFSFNPGFMAKRAASSFHEQFARMKGRVSEGASYDTV